MHFFLNKKKRVIKSNNNIYFRLPHRYGMFYPPNFIEKSIYFVILLLKNFQFEKNLKLKIQHKITSKIIRIHNLFNIS